MEAAGIEAALFVDSRVQRRAEVSKRAHLLLRIQATIVSGRLFWKYGNKVPGPRNL